MTRYWQAITIAFIAGLATGIAVAPSGDRPQVSRWDQGALMTDHAGDISEAIQVAAAVRWCVVPASNRTDAALLVKCQGRFDETPWLAPAATGTGGDAR